MPVRARSTTPAIKDQVVHFNLVLAALPPGTGVASTMFMNPWYDFEVKSITTLIRKATTASTAAPFTLGYGAYTNQHGVLVPANNTFFLTTVNCVDMNGTPLGGSAVALQPGALIVLPIPADNGLGSTVLPAGAPLVVTGPTVAGQGGEAYLTVILRPKDWDRGDSSKRPWGASDHAFATYYK